MIEAKKDSLSSRWRFGLQFLNLMRMWTFLPALLMTVLSLCIFTGGEALSIVFNTVAVLFMCEIDNLAYFVGLVESVRARVEHAGRCDLTPMQAKDLWFSKAVHLLSIPVTLVAPLPFIATGDQGLYAIGMAIPFFGYLFAGVLEVCGHDSFSKQVEGATEHSTCSRTCGVVRSWFLGLVLWLGCVVLSSL